MAEGHVSEELLGRFLRTEASRREAQQVVRHLLSGCPECSELAVRAASDLGLFAPGEALGKAGWEDAYQQVFARALAFATEEEQRLAVEKLRGWAQWASLEPLAPQVRFALVEADAGYHTLGLYVRLLEASRWHRSTEPAEAVDVVRLAILVAEHLDPAAVGEKRVADLRAAAWAALGNTQRIAEDFEGARRAFNEAWRILEEEGANDPVERASLISLEASYMKDMGEFELAESSLEEAFELYRQIGDAHQQGRVLLKMGEIIGHVNPGRGNSHIQRGLALIDMAKEPRLDLCAQHALGWFLNDSGRPEEALAVLDRARPLYKQFPDDFVQLRLHWLEGRIAHRRGEFSQAESIFQQLWEEFRVRNLNQEVVLVSIDLAEALTRKGEPARAAELAAQCYSIMRNWGLHTDALAAWLVFQDALAHGKAVGDLFGRIEEYYRRHWVRPGRFEM